MIKPIFLIGPPRSGTTLLGHLISQHKDICYWIEPKYIWKYPKPDPFNDVIEEDELKNNHIMYIRKVFTDFTKKRKKVFFLEKTPSNCLRIKVLKKIFPEGKYIFLVRDGRDLIPSLKKKWEGTHDQSAILRRINFKEYPISQIHKYLLSFIKQFLVFNVFRKKNKNKLWGPMTNEVYKLAINNKISDACAMQFLQCTESIFKNIEKHDMLINYENLLKNSKKTLENILNFCELDSDRFDFKIINKINTNNFSKYNDWSTLNIKNTDLIIRLEDINNKINQL